MLDVANRSKSIKNELEVCIRVRLKQAVSPKAELTTETGTRKQQRLQHYPLDQGQPEARRDKVLFSKVCVFTEVIT